MSDPIDRDTTDREPAPDPVLEAALRGLGPEPPMDTVDWERLERAIGGRARESFAGRERKADWWQPLAGWARPAIPLGLAAAIALFLILNSLLGTGAPPTAGSEGPEVSDPGEAILLGDELARRVYRGDSPTLLQAAFTYEDVSP